METNERLSFFGIGPVIGRFALPWLALTIVLDVFFPAVFDFGESLRLPMLIAGIVLIAFGLLFYLATLKRMLPGLRAGKLITGGAYRFCRNPLYAAILLFIFPGVSLAMNTWIVMTVSVVGFLVFRRNIKKEEQDLERLFGEEFRKYRDRTPLFFPNPFAGM